MEWKLLHGGQCALEEGGWPLSGVNPYLAAF